MRNAKKDWQLIILYGNEFHKVTALKIKELWNEVQNSLGTTSLRPLARVRLVESWRLASIRGISIRLWINLYIRHPSRKLRLQLSNGIFKRDSLSSYDKLCKPRTRLVKRLWIRSSLTQEPTSVGDQIGAAYSIKGRIYVVNRRNIKSGSLHWNRRSAKPIRLDALAQIVAICSL